MDCHRCVYLKYDGCNYGRCTHSGHRDVRLSRAEARKRAESGKRDYNRQICTDFKLRRKCSNCKHWVRGCYYGDGKTPARKGRCSLRILERGADCPLWKQGPTSWKKLSLREKGVCP